jgi:serine/threonine-protein kinase
VIGRRIGGRYEVLRLIAEGGMGAVYEAQHILSKKTVALKVLFPHLARDEASRQRFLREVSAPAQIGHEGIVEVYDAGIDDQDGSLFVAMELLRGETLRDRLVRGGMPREEILDLFEQLLEPLGAAHTKGFVHRDLKPENVFLHRRRDGREVVKLLDFGIARHLESGSTAVTHAGVAMGTPHYMAPEQALSARDVSFPADVWAVGAMLYEALAGRPPFEGETASVVLVQVCTRPHEPLRHVAPDTPAPLAALVDRCLEKEPSRRPPDARALLGELRAARGKSPAVVTHGVESNPMAPWAPRLASPPPTAHAAHAAGAMPGSPPAGSSREPAIWDASAERLTTSAPPPYTRPPARAEPVVQARPPLEAWPTPAAKPPVADRTPPGAVFPAPTPNGPSAPSQRARGTLGRAFLLVGALLAGLALVIGAAAIGLLIAATELPSGDRGTLRVVATVPGQLWIDGKLHGAVGIGSLDVSLSAGNHQVELRDESGIVESHAVTIVAGEITEVPLVRGVFAGAAAASPGTSLAPEVRSGTLAPGDRTLGSGEYMDIYEFSFRAGQRIHIEAVSTAFDAYLILRWPSGRQVDNDDTRGTDAIIEETLDETGVYRVIVTSFRPGETGPYTLTVR